MNRRFTTLCVTAVVCSSLASSAHAVQIAINPTDADTIKPFLNNNYNSKDYIYSYEADIPTEKHVAFMKFDLSSIPDDATITAMNLQMSTQLITSPGQVAGVHRGNNDNWSSTTTDIYPGTDEQLGPDQQIFSAFTYYSWILNVNAFTLQTDLDDDTLTLSIVSPGQFNWFGLDLFNPPRHPLLTIDYDLSCILGDTDSDADVDFDDFLSVNNFFGDTGPSSPGDADCDGDSDFDDFLSVNNFFGTQSPGISIPGSSSPTFGAVPEPASLSLLALGGLAIFRHRRIVEDPPWRNESPPLAA